MNFRKEAALSIHCNNVRQLRAALRGQPSLATENCGNGYTLLHWAAFFGSTECLRLLLASGACIDAATAEEDFTALYIAAQQGHDACVRNLLAAGANIEAAAKDGLKPLHIATLDGHLGCLQQLLDAGANVDAVDDTAVTASMMAAINGHDPCLQALLAAGANTDAASEEGFTALHYAATEGHTACSLLIGAHVNLDATDNHGRTALHYAAGAGHLPAIRCLVEAGASMAQRDDEGLTPRMRAIKERQLEAAQLLLELERQQAGRRQQDAPSNSRTPQQAEASGTATTYTAGAAAGPSSTAETSATGAVAAPSVTATTRADARVCEAEGCGKTSGLLLCSGCKAVRYCSEACGRASVRDRRPH